MFHSRRRGEAGNTEGRKRKRKREIRKTPSLPSPKSLIVGRTHLQFRWLMLTKDVKKKKKKKMSITSTCSSPVSSASSASQSARGARDALLVVEMIAKSVVGMASKNEGRRFKKTEDGANFECNVAPGISLHDYMLSPLFMRLKESTEIWKGAFILIKRLHARLPTLMTPLTVHRVVLCAFMVAMKCTSDRVLSNKLVAKYGGVAIANLNVMERHFLSVLDWDVFISKEEYVQLDALYSVPLSSAASKRLAAAVLFAR
eukprot:TRINITY_DN189_c1_g1_i3.p1 TRINITY_DN189_c1_g1~~TRINITY_DN189_c1_g1_i3.p1  ORF type:complete len:258 (+),score=35.57 TRINITY_DN189_c1_g1_i3:208-981(+)